MKRRRVALALAASVALGCSGEPALSGADEPIRVLGGTFKAGDLPGSPPVDGGVDGGAGAEPRVTSINSVNNIVRPGQAGKALSGLVSKDSFAVGVRFADLGTGYWLVNTDAPDPVAQGELNWSVTFDVAHDVPPGLHPLRFAAIDEDGKSGEQRDLVVCVTGAVPDNLAACDPSIEPPATVLSLTWDSPSDLDLGVITPTGRFVDAKHPTTAPLADGGVNPGPSDGAFDRDANAGCATNLRRENLIWQQKPEPGNYLVYVNMYDACDHAAARFVVTLWVAQPQPEGPAKLVEALRVPGELLAIDANGGEAMGLYLTSFVVQ